MTSVCTVVATILFLMSYVDIVIPGCKIFLQDARKIPEELICPHCNLVLNDPVQTTETGLRFCRECFNRYSVAYTVMTHMCIAHS